VLKKESSLQLPRGRLMPPNSWEAAAGGESSCGTTALAVFAAAPSRAAQPKLMHSINPKVDAPS
jgi:hypothetical protein